MPASLTLEQIKEYSHKWLTGTITDEEKKALEHWYNLQPPDIVAWGAGGTEATLREQIFDRITGNIRDMRHLPVAGRNKKQNLRLLAAASVVLFITAASLFFFNNREQSIKTITASRVPESSSARAVSYTRSVTLPDSSIVVLRANSTLDYPAKFADGKREVRLTGEAYFDIRHDESKPFIVYSGEIKTVVLGTAFNIKAYTDSKDVTVSVMRGKVRVEKATKEIAVLIPDQQVTCNTSAMAAVTVPSHVNAASIITDWAKQDMVFEDLSFQTTANLLSRRYAVMIDFKNAALAQCTIRAFFNGTETLDKVLKDLCLISNATYTRTDDGKIVIDGEGCRNH
ncbi:MAG: FecR domain-containing protein [Sphingobacteriales bacterium]|nr:FecR domain-containing protein [Sphingobacteriales bacterium]OJY87538.1 MAG: hypothetical protein BGP14_12475 [Sphingobacteriales bacterium 44-15]